jgi:hypothetical protein
MNLKGAVSVAGNPGLELGFVGFEVAGFREIERVRLQKTRCAGRQLLDFDVLHEITIIQSGQIDKKDATHFTGIEIKK